MEVFDGPTGRYQDACWNAFFSDSTRFSVELVYQHCVAIREIVMTVEEGVEASMHQSICLKIYKSTYIQYLIKYQSKL